ncbi:hypothetical protein MPLB_2300046 [Mesorhizobium sp. ORS 3324]|nr:hypothetical protein MPLB_2300046 [Mesorhizobium sp. ORS 3324]
MKPAQVRMARAALNWSLADLSKAAGVHRNTISNFETGKYGGSKDALVAIQRALEAAGVEFLGERQSLAALMTKWLAADPSRIELFGMKSGTSPEFVAELLVSDRHTNIATPAKNLIEILEGATDPIGQEILTLLRRVAGVEFIPENGGSIGVRLRKQ